MDGYPVLPDVPFQCCHDFDHLIVISDLLVCDIIATSGHKVAKDFGIELPMMELGYLLPSCLKAARPSLKVAVGLGVVILVWLYAVNLEEESEVIVCKEKESSRGWEMRR